MKVLISSLSVLASYIGIVVSKIWVIVSFLIYLIKDKPFNWLSVWLAVVSWVFLIVFYILKTYYEEHEKVRIRKNFRAPSTSKWQQRLNDMQEAQAKKIKNNGL